MLDREIPDDTYLISNVMFHFSRRKSNQLAGEICSFWVQFVVNHWKIFKGAVTSFRGEASFWVFELLSFFFFLWLKRLKFSVETIFSVFYPILGGEISHLSTSGSATSFIVSQMFLQVYSTARIILNTFFH